MANRKAKLPTHFCEWVVGTTIESVIGAIPQNKSPKKRDVVRVAVTTDDESEEDTVSVTYPRTGRNYTPPPANEAKAVAKKKVRFEARQNVPLKSAMKQTTTTTPVDSSDEASDSGPETESDSSQSAYISSSDATDSDIEYSVECVKHKRQRKKKRRQTQAEEDTESDWDSDPEPGCPCQRCTKGRQILQRVCQKRSKEITPPSPETSDSDEEEAPPNTEQQSGKNKRRCLKKAKPTEPDPNTSDSDSESEIPAHKKRSQTKTQGKQTNGKKPQTAPQAPMTKKERKAMNKKAKQQQEQEKEIESETSDSPKETEEETEPEEEPKKQNKGKQKNNKKQKGKQRKQEPENETNKDQEAAPADEAPEASKDTDQGKFRTIKGKAKAQPEKKGGVKKGNYPEGLPVPHMCRPQLVEPIRAQVVRIERVIKTLQDPAPNAYYDAELNYLRAYDGPGYGNHQSNALYPERDAFGRPLPMGQPHPMQNPFYYGFNNPQQYPNYPQMPPFHQGYAGAPLPPDAYSQVPITQGMAPPPWYAMGPPPGVPPSGYYGHRSPETNENTPVSKAEKNNVGPPGSLTGQANPYYKRKSQNNDWERWESRRSVPKENGHPPGSDKAGSNGSNGSNDWNKNNDPVASWNDGGADNKGQDEWAATAPDNNQNGNDWGTSNEQVVNDWNNRITQDSKPAEWPISTGEQDQKQNGSGDGSNHSNKSNDTLKKNGAHWGEDTYPGSCPPNTWGEQQTTSSAGQSADNNVGIWAPTEVNGSGNGDGNQNPPAVVGDGDNIMPGTWVESTEPVPAWGDATAARETNGQAVNW
ncbi:uncharacterized protein FTJAE_9438 [Fusarium tjaetaba]|uniref:Uncharacterized protein n=1 Tax=Fusarium tjaetaba TaxID=1567544 RepID=A0A8H5VJ89_9HYPO|nr:uncharacterized protein FTJAE_9438 [Fusarium tjaetaba]KAF5626852.1 hypothetical protein FTJAE_9438 [Fusarium tjaetaba]